MAITAAQVEANGWVLRVTVTGSLSSAIVSGYTLTDPTTVSAQPAVWNNNFSAYALAPSSTSPALTLAMTTSGFVQSAGTAVASSSIARTLIATKALRKATVATAAGVRDARNPDEVDNGDGTITVRIALSQHVYQGDSGLVLNALAGWRTGAGATTGFAVTNNSTIAAPAPIVRWADVPYKLQSGNFPLEVVVASHHPSGLAAIAGVKFTATDGTNTVTAWATAIGNSSYVPTADGTGQYVRVYGVTINPTTATPAALTQGLLRCDFTAYPWIGPAQTSDVAGTKSMTNLGTATSSTSAFVPFVVAYNPGGAWLTPRYAYVNASTGSATAAAANVSTNPATAAATPLASINLAIESLRLGAVTIAAANGQAAITQSVDGCHIRLTAGATLGTGTTVVTSGAQTAATWLVIEGDPADTAPRTDCILRTPSSANGANRVSRIKFANLAVEAGTNTVCAIAASWLDNVELRGASGQTTAATTPFGAASSVMFVTNAKWWQYGLGPAVSGSSQNPVLVRNVSVERAINAPVVLNCGRLPTAPSAATTGSALTASGVNVATMTVPSTDAGASLERMVIGCDLRYLNGAPGYGLSALANANVPTTAPYGATQLTLGTTLPVASRQAVINNVCEEIGSVGNPCFQSIGENTPCVSSENVIEGNTHTGDRTNNWYNDLNMATVALNDSALAYIQVNRLANNVYTKCASKHDEFNDPAVQLQRTGVALSTTRNKAYAVGAEIVIAGSPANIYHCTTAGTTASTGGPTGTGSSITDGSVVWQWIATENRQHGYRPQAITAWSAHYGVGAEGNIDFAALSDPAVDPNLIHEFFGVGSQRLYDSGISAISAMPWTDDESGTPNELSCQVIQATASLTSGSTTLTVTGVTQGALAVGKWVASAVAGIPAGTTLTALGTGTGGTGTYTMSAAATATASGVTVNAYGIGGGNYRPIATGSGTYLIGRAKSANVDVDQVGAARSAPFWAGAMQGPLALLFPGALSMMGFG